MVWQRGDGHENRGRVGYRICGHESAAASPPHLERMGYTVVCDLDCLAHHKSDLQIVQAQKGCSGSVEPCGWFWSYCRGRSA